MDGPGSEKQETRSHMLHDLIYINRDIKMNGCQWVVGAYRDSKKGGGGGMRSNESVCLQG